MLTQMAAPSRFWNGEALPLVQWNRFSSTDAGDVEAHMSRMFCPHRLDVQGGRPPIDFRHNQAQLKALTFNAQDYGNPFGRISIDVPQMGQIYLVQFSLTGTSFITHDRDSFSLAPGEMCVLAPDSHFRQTFEAGYKHFTIKIPKADLEQVLASELGFRLDDLVFSTRPVPLVGAAQAFAHLVRTICDDIDYGLTGYTHPRASGAVEDTLKRLLLAAVPHNHSELFDSAPSGPAPYYVRRVEDFVRGHACEAISLIDMIEISGVSARSLHAGFRRFRGVTPMVYLKNVRLDLARKMLLGGVEEGHSVTDVALACGFSHLSKFARDYAERFGERPSATLRQLKG
ncbi:AraC family transcriptional regulator [Sphingobium fuliginis]|uniref:AraC family transcriptional regulator n=2 Tax=Sphingobium fuliginis (strain ATCC 27551) TaxID=336203 RepID=A0A292ZM68_SPHSA|nr:AraC family transcriptional regulator [Sphingobium fuliginis]QOT73803.1 AraC family transcriptional regulator [Sphingobium fuliginis]GAY23963.1 probable transcriptional regulator, AraC family [Sphingobium fuliginis]